MNVLQVNHKSLSLRCLKTIQNSISALQKKFAVKWSAIVRCDERINFQCDERINFSV